MSINSLKILISGAAGTLGSALCDALNSKHEIVGLDPIRKEEAWRLANSIDKIEYVWQATIDVQPDILKGVDVVFDTGLGVADRPFGINSPTYTMMTNIEPPLRLLETARHLSTKKPIFIYPSSFNALYGYPARTKYSPEMQPNPSTVYGWTKAAVEMLYRTYFLSYQVPIIIVRVGSGYGPRMRADELPAKLILACLKDKKTFPLRSPESMRLWSYAKDLISFYEELLPVIDDYIGSTLHNAGNRDDKQVTNTELAHIIAKLTNYDLVIKPMPYEPGELVDGKPIHFDYKLSTDFWKPKYTLKAGLQETIGWFKQNQNRYI